MRMTHQIGVLLLHLITVPQSLQKAALLFSFAAFL